MPSYRSRPAIVCSDWHVGLGRTDWCLAFADFLIDLARRRRIRRLVHLGDVFHRRRVASSDVIETLALAFGRLTGVFRRIDIVAGNHDRTPGGGSGLLGMLELLPQVRVHHRTGADGDELFVPWGEAPPVDHERVRVAFCHLWPDDAAKVPADMVLTGHRHMPEDGNGLVVVGPSWRLGENDAGFDVGCVILHEDLTTERVVFDGGPQWMVLRADEADRALGVPADDRNRTYVVVRDVPPAEVPAVRAKLTEAGFAGVRVEPMRAVDGDDETRGDVDKVEGESVDKLLARTLDNLTAAVAPLRVVRRARSILDEITGGDD